MYGDTWGAWCEGSMDVTVDESGNIDGEGSCYWDLSDFGFGTDTTYFYPSGSVDEDGDVSGDVYIDAGDWGEFEGDLYGDHNEDSTDLEMQFDWDWQAQTVVFERD
jgi:hypothetical protein